MTALDDATILRRLDELGCVADGPFFREAALRNTHLDFATAGTA